MREIIIEVLKRVDPEIRQLMLKKIDNPRFGSREAWEDVASPILSILEMNKVWGLKKKLSGVGQKKKSKI